MKKPIIIFGSKEGCPALGSRRIEDVALHSPGGGGSLHDPFTSGIETLA
jgi:hypothetical protein